MAQFDITKTNVAVERELERTHSPWRRHLLMAYNRHRYLEMAGRYDEIFIPEMTVEHPVYRFTLVGLPAFKLDGRDQVVAMYQSWADTNQSIFYAANETLAVGDNMIVTRAILYQQQLGSELRQRGIDLDEDAMYLMKANIAMIWPYDDRGRMVGEDVWEYDDTDREFIKLDPADVLTTQQAAGALTPSQAAPARTAGVRGIESGCVLAPTNAGSISRERRRGERRERCPHGAGC